MEIKYKRLTPEAKMPRYAHANDSGMDVCANTLVEIPPRSHAKIPTGIAAGIPVGCELQVRPRSGLASKGIVAAFGTVDKDYTGEICVTLYNHTDEAYRVCVGDRIAQLVLAPVIHADVIEETGELGETERGANGFGSTGIQ